jgi:hypothetical protein
LLCSFFGYWVQISLRARCTTLCNKGWQWPPAGLWFSPGTPVSYTNKIDCHDITKILLKVAMLYTSPWVRFELTTLVVIGTDCIGSCKSWGWRPLKNMILNPVGIFPCFFYSMVVVIVLRSEVNDLITTWPQKPHLFYNYILHYFVLVCGFIVFNIGIIHDCKW